MKADSTGDAQRMADEFKPQLIFGSDNDDFGSSGLWLYDLDLDGDKDVLYTNGDAFDYHPPVARPWHGVQWLENLGDLKFRFHRIADYGGAVNARPADIRSTTDRASWVPQRQGAQKPQVSWAKNSMKL